MLFVPILLLFAQIVCGHQLSYDDQAYCAPFVQEKGKPAGYIQVTAKSSNSPIIIFHATDILKLKLPPPELYDPKKIDFGAIEEKDSMFKGEVSPKEPVRFEAGKSGMVCVYTASKDADDHFDVLIKNSYGYLEFMNYIAYKQSFFGNIIMIVVVVVLFRSLIASVGSDFLNLNRVSTVSKCSILYFLLPGIMVGFLTQIADFMANNSVNILVTGFREIVFMLKTGYSSIQNYIILMFCMGYGVLYDDRSGFKPMPPFNAHLCMGLLGVDVVLLIGSTVLSSAPIPGMELGVGITSTLLAITSFVWFVLCVYYGMRTHKSMKEFPPYSTNVEDYGLKNERIRKKFKRSLSLIFLVPMYSGILGGLIVGGMLKDKPLPPVDLPPEYQQLFVNDLLTENKSVLVFNTWNQFFIGMVIVVGIYYIWVREDLSELVSPSDQEADIDTI